MDYLFAGWRLGVGPDRGGDGQPYRSLAPADGKTLFETIEQSGFDDAETYIVARSRLSFAVLNVYPYTTGHLMVLPRQSAPSMLDLDAESYQDLWNMVRVGAIAVNQAFSPDGLNIGVNEGAAGGGSQPDHLHVHIVPRWSSDTNFMTSIAEARVLPVTLAECWRRLKEAWPQQDGESIGS